MAGMRTTIGIICMGVYREVLCHEYGKILRYTEQNTETVRAAKRIQNKNKEKRRQTMGKVIKINGAGAKEESLKDISENLHMLKRTLAGVVSEYEENEAEEKKTDLLTEALDALEDAYDAINEVLLDERQV